MREKYSINLTPPTQKEQTPTQMGEEEEESVRMAKAARGSSALPAALPHRELPGGGASRHYARSLKAPAAGHSWGVMSFGHSATPRGQPRVIPAGLRSPLWTAPQLRCSFQSMQTQ